MCSFYIICGLSFYCCVQDSVLCRCNQCDECDNIFLPVISIVATKRKSSTKNGNGKSIWLFPSIANGQNAQNRFMKLCFLFARSIVVDAFSPIVFFSFSDRSTDQVRWRQLECIHLLCCMFLWCDIKCLFIEIVSFICFHIHHE